jgi:hypothetical protein
MEESYVGKPCFWVDKVNHDKKYDGHPLGICIEETTHNLYEVPIVWFEKPFLGFVWQFKSDVRL